MLGQFLVRALNGFALPATWMASSKGLSKDVKYGFLYPYNCWENRLAVWRFVKDIPLEPNHPSKQILEETANSLKKFTSKHQLLPAGGLDDFASMKGSSKNGKSSGRNCKVTVSKGRVTIFWRIILKVVVLSSNHSLSQLAFLLAINGEGKEFEFVMGSKKLLQSREERSGNIVSIEPYDNTSNAYYRVTQKSSDWIWGLFDRGFDCVPCRTLSWYSMTFFLQIWKAFA